MTPVALVLKLPSKIYERAWIFVGYTPKRISRRSPRYTCTIFNFRTDSKTQNTTWACWSRLYHEMVCTVCCIDRLRSSKSNKREGKTQLAQGCVKTTHPCSKVKEVHVYHFLFPNGLQNQDQNPKHNMGLVPVVSRNGRKLYFLPPSSCTVACSLAR